MSAATWRGVSTAESSEFATRFKDRGAVLRDHFGALANVYHHLGLAVSRHHANLGSENTDCRNVTLQCDGAAKVLFDDHNLLCRSR